MNKKIKIKAIVIIFTVLMCFLIFNKILTKHENDNNIELKTKTIFENISQSTNAKVDKYIIYSPLVLQLFF